MTNAEILAGFRNLSVLVVGDICLDRWCTYDPAENEPSRETGLPRVAVTCVENTAGAAGTVANNLVALGAGRVSILGVIGEDGAGWDLLQALSRRSIDLSLLVRTPHMQTFVYTKLLNARTGEEDLPRVDYINVHEPSLEIEQEIASRIRQFAADFDVIIVSDQAETQRGGVVTAAVREALAEVGEKVNNTLIWVDSRRRIEQFRSAVLKVNDDEADAAALRIQARTMGDVRSYAGAPLLIVTRGAKGVSVYGPRSEHHLPGRRVERPVDICGAGDSFSAGGAMALAVTKDPVTAAHFGNLVASITIMKKGTGTASPEEVLAVA